MTPIARVLLVEDDPVSRAVLAAAVERCGVIVDTADCVQAALRQAAPARHALWLIDAHLPDGSGIELLAALRSIDPVTVAIAHTASADSAIHRRLRDAGFVDVMIKPLPSERVAETLRTRLPASVFASAGTEPADAPAEYDATPLWDEAAALRALGGNRSHVDALRELFTAELPDVAARVAAAVHRHDAAALHAQLHRLHASCGFVGAARVASAVRALESCCNDIALRRFETAVDATLAASGELQPG